MITVATLHQELMITVATLHHDNTNRICCLTLSRSATCNSAALFKHLHPVAAISPEPLIAV